MQTKYSSSRYERSHQKYEVRRIVTLPGYWTSRASGQSGGVLCASVYSGVRSVGVLYVGICTLHIDSTSVDKLYGCMQFANFAIDTEYC